AGRLGSCQDALCRPQPDARNVRPADIVSSQLLPQLRAAQSFREKAVKTLTMIGATCAVLLASAAAFAQDKPMRVRGTVEQVDGTVMTVKSREGDTLKIKLADEGKVVALVKASLADSKPNSFGGSTAMPQPDGSWKAVEVHIFPEEMRGTGEGDRPYDYRPQSTMTNGTVNSVGKSTTTGTVANEEGTTLTLN